MFNISTESLAPRMYAKRREFHLYDSQGRVPEIVYCLFLCKAVRKQLPIEEITGQAIVTNPQFFSRGLMITMCPIWQSSW